MENRELKPSERIRQIAVANDDVTMEPPDKVLQAVLDYLDENYAKITGNPGKTECYNKEQDNIKEIMRLEENGNIYACGELLNDAQIGSLGVFLIQHGYIKPPEKTTEEAEVEELAKLIRDEYPYCESGFPNKVAEVLVYAGYTRRKDAVTNAKEKTESLTEEQLRYDLKRKDEEIEKLYALLDAKPQTELVALDRESILYEIRMCTTTSGEFLGGMFAERMEKFGTPKNTKANDGLSVEALNHLADQAIGDKVGYFKDELGIVDVVITAIHAELQRRNLK